MGQMGGVRRLAQGNYEKGERLPDAAYLTAIAEAGADVGFILTGQRQTQYPDSVSGSAGNREQESFTNPSALTGLEGGGEQPPHVDLQRMEKIVEMLDDAAKQAGRRWPAKRLIRVAVEIYNFLQDEQDSDIDEQKIERVLKLVVNR